MIHSLFPKMWVCWARADGLCWALCPGPGDTAIDSCGAASLMVFFDLGLFLLCPFSFWPLGPVSNCREWWWSFQSQSFTGPAFVREELGGEE